MRAALRSIAPGPALLALAVAAMIVAVVACAVSAERAFSLGVHEVSLTVPDGFEVVENEREVLFRNGLAFVVLADVGPCNTEPGTGLPLDQWLRSALNNLGVSRQQEVATEETVVIDGREVHVIGTWDRLTHDQWRLFAMTENSGRLLGLYTRPGDFPRASAAFESILASLAFSNPGS
jgi:hypothetical protein